MSQAANNTKLEDLSDDDEASICESTDSLDSSDSEAVISTQTLGDSQLTESDVETVRQALDKLSPAGVNNSVYISNSQNVHIGAKTTVTGNIIIQKKFSKGSEAKVRRQRRKAACTLIPAEKIPKTDISIIPRWQWLAQRAMGELDRLEEPVEYVVISHTATESDTTPAKNKLLIRTIQVIHIESMHLYDIAYNFLIGCDGNVYEGRGFGAVGSHTPGYNANSLGISFVGCFINELPSQAALDACQNLLKKAVKSGHLSKDYKLIAHCQVKPTGSPERMLLEHLQTWEHCQAVNNEKTDNEETRNQKYSKKEEKPPTT